MKFDTSIARLLSDPWHFLALGCGSGLINPGPGTWGSLLGLLFWWALLSGLPPALYALWLLIAVAAGIWLCGRTGAALGQSDHPAIVWDEFAGLWLACLALPQGWYWPLLAFLLFRLLDIFKPWPIRLADQHIGGGWGVMLDDLIAGAFTLVIIQLLAWLLRATGTI